MTAGEHQRSSACSTTSVLHPFFTCAAETIGTGGIYVVIIAVDAVAIRQDSFLKEIQNPPLEIFKASQTEVLQVAFLANNIKPAGTTLCTGKIKRSKSGYLPQFEALVRPREIKNIKLTLAAPEWFHLRHREHAYRLGVYANRDEYFDGIAAAYRRELKVSYSAGLCNAQFDDPLLAYFCAEPMLKGMQEVGKDSEALLDCYIRLYNDCLACCYLVTSKFLELEDVGALRERMMEAAKVMAAGTGESKEEALTRICVSPQCAFASFGGKFTWYGRYEKEVGIGQRFIVSGSDYLALGSGLWDLMCSHSA
ncbi:hypothetical protein EDD15DRAFT_2473063 [Pisolithus albus]|nr:hypothetical protein EDD15DRAFT_2473063 [Pisolithus albus]